MDKIAILIKDFSQGLISRREFMQRAVLWTGSVAVASSLLDSLSPSAAHANQVDPNDPALISTDVKYAAPDGASINAYVTRPKGDGRRPGVQSRLEGLPVERRHDVIHDERPAGQLLDAGDLGAEAVGGLEHRADAADRAGL